jgi:FkbM family methyltransferase
VRVISIHSKRGLEHIAHKVQMKVYRTIVHNDLNLYVRVNDRITENLLLRGAHDFHVIETIKFLNSNRQFDQVFVDIGANLGFVSTQVGAGFNRLYLFEPNHKISRVLHANLELNFKVKKFKLYKFALGRNNSNKSLTVPDGNVGGAFIRSSENIMTDLDLASKDNFSDIGIDTHSVFSIKMKKTRDIFRKLFAENKVSNKWLIKIDCEGMDLVILQDILEVMPNHISVAIIFENHIPIILSNLIKFYNE